jgi:pimeloyl-ACP methyl ester carboxylesterase
MRSHSAPKGPPSRTLMLLELRAMWELGVCVSMAPLLGLAPRGDGHPVLVLPGFVGSDLSTQLLRTFLRDRGYRAHGWKLGRNLGPRPGVEERMRQRLDELAVRYQSKVSLIGWSLGGVFARELARNAPERVRGVITLGSPFAGEPDGVNPWVAQLYETLSGRRADDWPERERMKEPPPMPSTAIYSRTDGVVAWRGCMEREGPISENIEIQGSHCGLGHNPAALYAIADRLAQPEGDWRPFDRSGIKGLVYRDPNRDGAAMVAA